MRPRPVGPAAPRRSQVPERLRFAVDGVLAAGPAAVLEIGCGSGVALALLADAGVGVLHGVDRSASAVRAARGRLGARGVVHETAWADLELFERFDVLLAVRVNLLWTRDPAPELAVAARSLRPGGLVHLVWDGERAVEVGARAAQALTGHGWRTVTEGAPGLVRVLGVPP